MTERTISAASLGLAGTAGPTLGRILSVHPHRAG